jgi:transcriptional regulator with XRE-family HTH domain
MRYLRYVREKAELTQARLAELSGVPQAAISRIERGGRAPRDSTLEKLAGVLDVEHPSWLAVPMAPYTTFEELIEGTPEGRQTYIEVMRESGTLDDFVNRLDRLFQEGVEDYQDDSLTLFRVKAAFMLGYAKAIRERREPQKKASDEE